jgi:hypothetical protein
LSAISFAISVFCFANAGGNYGVFYLEDVCVRVEQRRTRLFAVRFYLDRQGPWDLHFFFSRLLPLPDRTPRENSHTRFR